MNSNAQRPRRLRANPILRDLVRETTLSMNDFVYPLFVHYGTDLKREIKSMPGQYQLSLDRLLPEAEALAKLGVRALLLFGIPEHKDERGGGAYAKDGIVQQALRLLKQSGLPFYLVSDVCLCEYTSHGHCGLLSPEGKILNDPTLPLLTQAAVSHAEAGADMVAPSDMMDFRVAAIRAGLDAAGYADTQIMSYAAKYASAFYGPFRDAAGSTPAFGDRRSHQMDPANAREALREMQLDLDEGADIVMVKPALAYLDIIRQVKDNCRVPVAAYAVSGEYSMIEAAANLGWISRERVVYEQLTGIKRAGADLIITYHAPYMAQILGGK